MELTFDQMVGRTITKIEQHYNTELVFTFSDGDVYVMRHHQDCCESVTIEDIVGDLDDLIDNPLLMSEEVSSEAPAGYESATWTFYKLATIKGYVTIRWLGTSNGYYSERVSWDFVGKDENAAAPTLAEIISWIEKNWGEMPLTKN